jgi:hypothetical protein
MGLVIIFAIIAIVAAIGAFRSLKNKYFLAAFWGIASFLIFGWFSIMTVIHQGFPAGT